MGEILTLIVLGVLLGLADIFPISSTGHMALLRHILNLQPYDFSLAVGLHGGSLIAITYYFRRELVILWRNFITSLKLIWLRADESNNVNLLPPEALLPYRYIVSLFPVAVEALALRGITQSIFVSESAPLILLMLNGGILLVTALIARGERSIKELTWKEFILIGVIQGVSVLPGISRLGVVLCTGLLFRLKWQEALKLTFIISIPVVIGALIVESRGIFNTLQAHPELIASFLSGCLLACLGSWLCLVFLNSQLLERRRMILFGYYCIMLGSFSFVFLYFWQ